ncbi:hypothetical protein B0H16DRAFT_1745426 [Mycena metata]|uniref:Uncharacterized protein n=1 Tax=Mycena metata TaxID=1033252 RepID=A0AAD7MCR0_9AGAR|nr:hypothetical protein B0H16DRAFT_1745426 [Mycena metata]
MERTETTDAWANWLMEYEEVRRTSPQPPYAIMHYPASGWWNPGRETPLDLMTRADLVAHSISSSPSQLPTRSTLLPSSPHLLTVNPRTRYNASGGPLLNVFVETYPGEDFNLLLREFDVYTAVAHLDVVPKLNAVIKGRETDWGGMVMEHADTALSNHNVP